MTSQTPYYNTKQGIMSAIGDSSGSLKGFVKLINDRHEAYYARQEDLHEFYVLGRYFLDRCGNCLKIIEGWLFDPIREFLQLVMTKNEFFQILRQQEKRLGKDFCFSSSFSSNVPGHDLLCPECGQGWDLSNCHDTYVRDEREVVPLTDFIGQTLAQVKDAFGRRRDAKYTLVSEKPIKNARFIDLSPAYPVPEHDWQKSLIKNEYGWAGKGEGIDDDYIIQEGDEALFFVLHFFHEKCHLESLAKETETKFGEIFVQAGFEIETMTRVTNEYGSLNYNGPWFRVSLIGFGTITIGWRKRVINIDWSSLQTTPGNAGEAGKVLRDRGAIYCLFRGEDVTRDYTSIHAHGWEKAGEYLKKIHDYLVGKIEVIEKPEFPG